MNEIIISSFTKLDLNLTFLKKYKNIHFLIGLKDYSSKMNNYFSLEEIEKFIFDNNLSQRIILNLNILFHENQIDNLIETLIKIAKLKCKVIFSDVAIIQINKENNLNLELIYNPETLNTSYGTIDFWNQNNIYTLFLARELSISEIKQIKVNAKSTKLICQVYGHNFMMDSKRTLITNYKNYLKSINKESEMKPFYFVKEANREIGTYFLEDQFGTHMYTEYCAHGFEILNQLKEIDYFYLDNLFHEDVEFKQIVELFIQANRAFKFYNSQFWKDKLNEITSNKLLLAGQFGENFNEIYQRRTNES